MSAMATSADYSIIISSNPSLSSSNILALPEFSVLTPQDSLHSPPVPMDTDSRMAAEASLSPPRVPSSGSALTPRVNQACASCRRKKVRCDGGQPHCNNCSSRGIPCTYLAQKKRGRPPKAHLRRTTGPYFTSPLVSASVPGGTPMAGTSYGVSQGWPHPTEVHTDALSALGARNQQQTPPPSTYFAQWPTHTDAQPGYGTADSLAFGTSAPTTSALFQQHAYAPAASSELSLFYGNPAIGSSTHPHLLRMGTDGTSSDEFGSHPSFLSSDTQLTPAADHSQPPPMAPGQMAVYPASGFNQNARVSASAQFVRQYSGAAEPHLHTAPTVAVSDGLSIQGSHARVYQISHQNHQPGTGVLDFSSIEAHSSLFSGHIGSAGQICSAGQIGSGGHMGSAGQIGSAATDIQQSDYFSGCAVPSQAAPPQANVDGMNLQGTGTFYASGAQSLGCIGGFCSSASQSSIVQHLGATSAAGVPIFIDVARQAIVSPAALPVTRASGINGSGLPGRSCSTVLNQFAPLTAPSPMPPLLQTRAHTVTRANPDLSTVVSHAPRTIISSGSALSLSLGNVAIAMARSDVDSASVQTTLDHLSHVANNISSASYDALMQAKEAAAEAVVTNNQADTSKPQLVEPLLNAPIHESLLRIERRSELSGKAIHNYFCYLHQQCPIIHKPTFLQQIDDGSVNRFVWLSVRALASRTLLHTNTLSAKEVLIEEEYFANKAQSALSDELKKPSVDVVQGLALLSLYIFGTPRWQEASMYWCKATRLAQLMDFHVIDAPSGAIATKMHFGIFEPPKVGNTHKTDLALIPGDFSGQHTPLAQALTPLEAELRRRLWWILFTNERFCAIAERLPTMVNEARMFVHFPCSARDWDSPEFTYSAPDRVPRYQREGYMRVDLGSNMCNWTLGQELRRRKGDNLYMISEIEYGFSMSHLVAFLADMGALFRPRSPYGNDYTPVFMEMAWPTKMKMLRANVERVERIFEMVRQDILHMLAETPKNSSHVGPASSSTQSSDPVLDPNALAPGIEIPQLHHLAMLILYSTLNIHLYRMVFQIHYEFSSSLPKPADRRPEDSEVLAAFDLYVKELWARTTTTAQQVSRILRGEFPGVPSWVLTLAGIKPSAGHTADARSPSNMACSESESREGSIVSTHMSSESEPQEPANGSGSVKSDSNREQSTHRLRNVFRKRIQEQETRLHEMAQSVMASFRRTLPYALLLVAKVHLDNIESGAGHINDSDIARSYLDLADAVQFLETHQTLFTSADYVSLVKGMMHTKP